MAVLDVLPDSSSPLFYLLTHITIMKELQITFSGRGETRGFMFWQLLKKGTAYLYRVDTSNLYHHYEVFERKENERYGTITYPSAQAFGRYAWTYLDLSSALNKYHKL